jgi:3-oxoacyl-[acyl-carrier-protein] synthase-1
MSALQVGMAARVAPLSPRATPFVDASNKFMGAVRARGLPDRLVGAERLVRLAAPALEEATQGLEGALTLIVALPERGRPDDTPDFGQRVLAGLAAALGRTLDPASAVVRAGHAGGALALEAAVQRAGAGGTVVVGGVDSYFHEGVLLALDEACRLHSAEAENGFIPGEAAAFACLTGGDERSLPTAPQARLVAVANEREETAGTDRPNLGVAATAVVRRLVAQAEGAVRWVVNDANGEDHRAREEMKVLRRVQEHLAQPFELALPSFGGDVGAASGALAIALACVWWSAACAPARQCLVTLASEGPERGGFLLEGLT